MNKLLETLYHSLYTPLELAELQSEISSFHHQLTKRMDKPGHKLLLKMVDDYDHLVGMQSMDSFFCGLKLGLDIAYGLKHYDGHLLGAGRKILCKRFSTKSRMALESRADSGLNSLITESHGGQNGMRAGTA